MKIYELWKYSVSKTNIDANQTSNTKTFSSYLKVYSSESRDVFWIKPSIFLVPYLSEENAQVYNFDTSPISFDFIPENMGSFTIHNPSVCSDSCVWLVFIKHEWHTLTTIILSQVFSVWQWSTAVELFKIFTNSFIDIFQII